MGRPNQFLHALVAFITLFCFEALARGRDFSLELEAVEGASAYEIELKSSRVDKAYTFKNQKPEFSIKVKPGPYSLRFRSHDDRGVPGPWSEYVPVQVKLAPITIDKPKHLEVLTDLNREDVDVEIAWQPVDSAKSYRVTIEPGGIVHTTEEPRLSVSLKNGVKYSLNVVALGASGDTGETADSQVQFELRGPRVEKVELPKEIDRFVREIATPLPKYAETMTLTLERLDNGQWVNVITHQDHKVDTVPFSVDLPGGHYRLQAIAKGSGRVDSEPATVEFDAAENRSDEAASDQLKQATLVNESSWNLTPGGQFEMIDYTFESADTNRRTNFQANGLSGFVQIDKRFKSVWHALVKADARAMMIAGRGLILPNVQAQGGYLLRLGRSTWDIKPGVFYRTVPIATQLSTATTQVSTGASVGVSGELQVRVAFSTKWSSVGTMQFLYDFLRMSTPNGQALKSSISMETRLGAAYRFTPNLRTTVEFSYRRDHFSYGSIGGSPDLNRLFYYSGRGIISLDWGF